MLTTSQKHLSTRKTKTYQAAFREGFFRRPCRRGWSLIPLPEGHWVLTKQKLLRWLRGGRCPNGRTARKKKETKQKKHAYDPQPKKKKKKVNTWQSTEKALLRYRLTRHCLKYTCKAMLAKLATNMYKCCFAVFPWNIHETLFKAMVEESSHPPRFFWRANSNTDHHYSASFTTKQHECYIFASDTQ